MLKLLRFLITGVWNKHEHAWEIIEKRVTAIYWYNEKPCGHICTYVQKCTGCGELKSFTVRTGEGEQYASYKT